MVAANSISMVIFAISLIPHFCSLQPYLRLGVMKGDRIDEILWGIIAVLAVTDAWTRSTSISR
ncbi:hypothetical protein [Archaeoglobus sp. UBA230]|uniref:hypothetical protein n=1 Tax=Archaeoglobus sp. UBA230 TaxID=1915565 RepID=UPI0025BC63A9|nr:hypothetical protein [Archaeoglobus sp. UBA230]